MYIYAYICICVNILKEKKNLKFLMTAIKLWKNLFFFLNKKVKIF